MCRHGAAPLLGLLHDEDQREHAGKQKRQEREHIVVGHDRGLLLHHAKDHRVGLLGGGGQVRATRHHRRSDLLNQRLRLRIINIHVPS